MKGSLIFENRKVKLEMERLKLINALERKMGTIDKDYDEIYYRHYQFKANDKRAEQLRAAIRILKGDIDEYRDILDRLLKYNEEQRRKDEKA